MGYIINGVEYSHDSATNQSIVDKLVRREVFCCMTSEMEYMLGRVHNGDENNPFTEDDLINTYLPECPHCHSTNGFDEVAFEDVGDEEFKCENGASAFVCPLCDMEYDTIEEAKDCCSYEENLYRCNECNALLTEYDYDRLNISPVEVYEWWAVSNWLGEKLREHGCVVIDAWGKSYWGRECTGQAISLDSCIVNIAADMGILEGMEHEWTCS